MNLYLLLIVPLLFRPQDSVPLGRSVSRFIADMLFSVVLEIIFLLQVSLLSMLARGSAQVCRAR